MSRIVDGHGGYRDLEAFKMATIIYDGTVVFCGRFIDPRSRTTDQMIQAARSGQKNIAEGSMAAATSRKTEIKLTGVARASLGELLLDYEDFLRQRNLLTWDKDDEQALEIRRFAVRVDRSYKTYAPYIEQGTAEQAANTLICMIHQTMYLLRKLLEHLERRFLQDGGFTERLYKARREHRDK